MPFFNSLNLLGDMITTGIIKSTVATGTAPLVVNSTTVIPNLNASLLQGNAASAFYLATNPSGFTSNTGTVTAVNDGNGMDFTSFTTSGTITLGTPSSLTDATTNAVTADSHTHAITNYSLTGTANQINITGAGKVLGAAITLSLPQSIATTSTPTFGRLSLSQDMTNGATGAFTNPHLALVPTGTVVDNTGFVGITFGTSTSPNYGYSAGALRSTNGGGNFVIRNHFSDAAGVEVFRLSSLGKITLPTSGTLTTETGPLLLTTSAGNGNISLEPSGNGVITHTKALASKGNTYTSTWMQFDEDVNGNALYLGSGALTVIGAGESIAQVRGNIGATTEGLVLAADDSTTSTAFRFIASLQNS
jgi:hypothetical protein